ncbi:MAG: toll/interleukin-1 receptor domain-containing protein [Anaerolineae bacterium]|nr:toll/interleukin-1 receptor domain-containing protein [Anaerolineae bacterium]
MQHQVFLSYSHQDALIMQRVRDDLRTAGLSVWTDEGIEPGTLSWKRAIQQAIETTTCLVAILSPAAKASEWVERELEYARVQGIPVIPMLAHGDERTSIPFDLITRQFVDIRIDYQQGIHHFTNWFYGKFEVQPAQESPAPLEAFLLEPKPQGTQANERDADLVRQLALTLTQQALDVSAEAIFITRKNELVAQSGSMSRAMIHELITIVGSSNWDGSHTGARVRFIDLLSNGQDYMMYSVQTMDDMMLSMVFKGTTSLLAIRRSAAQLVKALGGENG